MKLLVVRRAWVIFLFFGIVFVPIYAQASTGSSMLAGLYCKTLGLWLSDAFCKEKVVAPPPSIVTQTPVIPPAPAVVPIPPIPLIVTPSITTSKTANAGVSVQSLTVPPPPDPNYVPMISNVSKTTSEPRVDMSQFVTYDFLNRQVDLVQTSIGNSIRSLSDTLNARIDGISTGGGGISDLSSFTTNNLTEGLSNLYFTDARVGSYISGSSTIPHIGGSAWGNLLFWNSSGWATIATSSLGITGGSSYTNSDANAYIHASSTIPKTYTANTWSALQIFQNASSTLLSSTYASTTNLLTGALTVGSLTGPLQAIGGVVSASSTLSTVYGGTGVSTAPAYGQLLLGNASGGYTLTATSSLGITPSQWTTSSSNIYYNTGNVGIGTTSPYAKLSVVGEVVAPFFTATSTTATSTFGGNLVTGTGSSTARFTTDQGFYGLQFPNASQVGRESQGIIWGKYGDGYANYSGSIWNFVDHFGSFQSTEMIYQSVGDMALIVNSSNASTGGRIQIGLGSIDGQWVTMQGSNGSVTAQDPLHHSIYQEFNYGTFENGVADNYKYVGMRAEGVKTDGTGELVFYNPGLTWTAGGWTGTGNKTMSMTKYGIWAKGAVIGTGANFLSSTSPLTNGLNVEGNVNIGTSTLTTIPLGVVGPSSAAVSSVGFLKTGNAGTVGLKIQATSGSVVSSPTASSLTTQPKIWLKADALGLSDGASVNTWTDSSGNGNNGTNIQNAGVYHTSGQGSKPYVAVAFSDYNINTTISSSTPTTIFFVTNLPNTYPTGGRTYILDGNNCSDSYRQQIFQESNGALKARGDLNLSDLTTSTSISNSVAIFRVVFNGSSSVIYRNGTLVASGVNTGSSGAFNGIHIGATCSNTNWSSMDMSEFILYNGTFSNTDILKIETYLGDKYGITVASTAYDAGTQSADLLQLQDGAGGVYTTFNSAGSLGIGTSSPSSALSITQSANTRANGIWLAATDGDYRAMYMDTSGILNFNGGDGGTLNTATLNAAGAWTNASDMAYKENITALNTKYSLEDIMKIEPRFYTMKGTGKPQIGFIAQELKPIIPEVVEGTEGSMGISYGNLVALLVQGIKELNTKVTSILAWFSGGKLTVQSDVCVDTVCVTKDQFKALLLQAGGTTNTRNNVQTNSNTQSNGTTTLPTATATTTAATSTEPVVTSTTTPVVVPETIQPPVTSETPPASTTVPEPVPTQTDNVPTDTAPAAPIEPTPTP